MRTTGKFVTDSTVTPQAQSFVPKPLPPDPPLELTAEDYDLIDRANLALGRLDGLTTLLPDTNLLIYMYVRKEAVLSSQIEGTVSSLEDLLVHESKDAPGVPAIDDTQEVVNYVLAIEHGLKLSKTKNLPIAGRLLKETHRVLLNKGRGASKEPGEYRRNLVRIGGTGFADASFIPPPAAYVADAMADLERFLNDQPVRTPTLLKAALAHVQFETIHPFRDGNGRLGRLLITLLLCAERVLRQPTLYLSLYFKTHRQTYYDKLQRVRTDGDWEGWVRFFLQGVLTTATKADELARAMLKLFDTHRRQLEGTGRQSSSALRVHHFMQRKPIFSIPQAAAATKLTQPTVWAVINTMKTLRLVRELSEYKHPRLFSYGPYIRLLSEQTMEEEPSEAGPILRTESEPLSATAFAVGDKLR